MGLSPPPWTTTGRMSGGTQGSHTSLSGPQGPAISRTEVLGLRRQPAHSQGPQAQHQRATTKSAPPGPKTPTPACAFPPTLPRPCPNTPPFRFCPAPSIRTCSAPYIMPSSQLCSTAPRSAFPPALAPPPIPLHRPLAEHPPPACRVPASRAPPNGRLLTRPGDVMAGNSPAPGAGGRCGNARQSYA